MRLGALATVLLGFLAAIPMAGGLARAQSQDQAKSPPAPAAEVTRTRDVFAGRAGRRSTYSTRALSVRPG